MRLFRREQVERIKQFEYGSLIRQKTAMECMRADVLRTASEAESRATWVSRYPELRSTTQISSAYMILLESSKFLPRTAQSGSRTLVWFQVSRVLWIAKNDQGPYRWESSPEKLLYLCRTTSHPGVTPILQQNLGPILRWMSHTIRSHPSVAVWNKKRVRLW